MNIMHDSDYTNTAYQIIKNRLVSFSGSMAFVQISSFLPELSKALFG